MEGLEFAGVEEEALILGLTPASIQGMEDGGGGGNRGFGYQPRGRGYGSRGGGFGGGHGGGRGRFARGGFGGYGGHEGYGGHGQFGSGRDGRLHGNNRGFGDGRGHYGAYGGQLANPTNQQAPHPHGYIDPAGGLHQQQPPAPAQAAAALD